MTNMKGTDKLLMGIVGGVILLVVVAFIVVLSQPEPTYQPEDKPEGVAHNYLLALRQQAYDRAYGYLADGLAGRPDTLQEFTADIDRYSWSFRDDTEVTLGVTSVQATDNRATVTIQETRFYNNGLFDSSQQTSTFTMDLVNEDGTWKITDSDAYWVSCWQQTNGCP